MSKLNYNAAELTSQGPEHSLSSIRKFVFASILITSICLFTGIGMAEDFDLKVVLGIGIVVVFFLAVFLFGKVMKQAQEREDSIRSHVQRLEVERRAQKKANAELREAQISLSELNSSLEQAFESLQQSADEAEERVKEIEEQSYELERLTEEADTIFNSIDNGICLLDRNYKIGNKLSLAMYEIFETEDLAGVDFVSLMKPMISEKDLKTLSDFLELQFGGKTMTKQLDKFNPLKKIEITLNWNGEDFSTKYLGFKFQRVMEGERVGAVLVSVSDLTAAVVLENELKRSVVNQEKKTVAILEILNSKSERIVPFIKDASDEVENINLKLKELGDDNVKVTGDDIDAIYRKIHTIKGNASLIQLQSVVDLSNEIEKKLSDLRERKNISGDQLVGALVQLASFKELLGTYSEVSDTILKGVSLPDSPASSVEADDEVCEFVRELRHFVEQTAHDIGKKVMLRTDIDFDGLSEEQVTKLTGIIMQAVRNSIAHGIEYPSERIKGGKIETGLISVICRPSTGYSDAFDLVVRDDGAGLDTNALKKRAVELGLITASEAESLSVAKAVGLIFKNGFTSVDEGNTLAGRGIGMDVMKHTFKEELGGKLNMGFSKGHYMMLKGVFPKSLISNREGALVS